MLVYTFRRILQTIPLLLAVATVTFILMRSIQGGPFDGDKPLSETQRANLERRYGLDDPLPVQYVNYIVNIATWDLGITINNREVWDVIKGRMQVSVQLGIMAFLFAFGFGLVLGTISAIYQNGIWDYVGVFVATIGAALPAFVMAPLLVILFALQFNWFNVLSGDFGFTQWFRGDFSNWRQMILPTVAMGFAPMAFVARITRSAMVEVLRQDYIRTARAKGVTEQRVVLRHGMKNALIPVLTISGPIFAGLITGSLVIERAFAIPGLGQEFVVSILNRDYGLIMGVTIFFTIIIVAANLIVDLLYAVADPRIRL